MKLQFIGATGTVTGSKFLLTHLKQNILVDCGLFQGLKSLRLRNWERLPIDPRKIDAVILTHAHIDHSGYIPLLVKNGFRGKIYATSATKALCQILLPDSGRLQEEDAIYNNKHKTTKHSPALPLYTEEEAWESLKYFENVSWGKKVSLSKHVSFCFNPAGHILGAGFVSFNVAGRRVTFSGDLGRPTDQIMNKPASVVETDYLLIESTYGHKHHPHEDPKGILEKIIKETVARNGIVLIPAFAVGRAQQILLLVGELKKEGRIPNIPIYLNSPMAVRATELLQSYGNEIHLTDEQRDHLLSAAHIVTSVDESKKLNSLKDPSIIISASGMATGGRVLHHLKTLLPDERNTVLFAGFQAAGTRGEALANGAETIKIHGEMVSVRAQIKVMDTLSAHADSDELMAWLKEIKTPPHRTFIVHGEPEASEGLKKRIEDELHWDCEIPKYLQVFEFP